MIRDYKKLFSRDKIFLLCLTGAVALVLLYGLEGCRQMAELIEMQEQSMTSTEPILSSYWEKVDMVLKLWGSVELDTCHFRMLEVLFWIVAAAQIAKWHILEGKHGKEFQKLIPLKSKSHITYDYILGIIYVWCPIVVSWLAVNCFVDGISDLEFCWRWMTEGIIGVLVENTFLYVLLVFSRRITNNMPGALLSSFVIWFGLYLIEFVTEGNICFFNGGLGMDEKGAAVLAVLTVLGIISTYLCDKKRDIARNGAFSFGVAHYLILGALFVELAVLFGVFFQDTEAGEVLSVAYGLFDYLTPDLNLGADEVFGMVAGSLLSGAVTFGIHYIARPKRL